MSGSIAEATTIWVEILAGAVLDRVICGLDEDLLVTVRALAVVKVGTASESAKSAKRFLGTGRKRS